MNSQSFRRWLLRPECMPFHHQGFMKNINKMVEQWRIELQSSTCKADIIPLYYNPIFLVRVERIELSHKPWTRIYIFWYLERDSNSQSFRRGFLRPACIPFHHLGIIFGALTLDRTEICGLLNRCNNHYTIRAYLKK